MVPESCRIKVINRRFDFRLVAIKQTDFGIPNQACSERRNHQRAKGRGSIDPKSRLWIGTKVNDVIIFYVMAIVVEMRDNW